MELSEKDLIYQSSGEYLEAREPQEVEDFEVVFDATFGMLTRQLEADLAPVQEAHGRLRFDSPFAEVTAIASVVWMATLLVRAVVRGPRDEDILVRLGELEAQLVEHTRQRERVEGLVETLERRVVDLARLRRDSGEPLPRKPWPSAAPVDLLLRVKTRPVQGGLVFDYELTSPSGRLDFQAIEATSERLHARALKQEHMRLFSGLERLLGGLGEDGEMLLREDIEDELESLGQDLYLRLFPETLKAVYRQHRYRIRSLMVLSDEPWIPWELVRPHEFEDDDFLCMLFPMARWFAGPVPPAGAIQVERLLCVEAAEVEGYPTLHSARAERERLAASVEEVQGLTGDFLDSATHSGLINHLKKGGFDLIHFAGHADYDAGEPDRSRLVLTDRPFRATKLTGPLIRRIQEDRSLVFLSACRAAHEGLALTGVGGWPDRWVRLGHCGALLSPQWAVRDCSAGNFAGTFYRRLREGTSLGEAALDARRRLREANPSDPTYLAYSLYGHPNAIVGFGAEAVAKHSRQTNAELAVPSDPKDAGGDQKAAFAERLKLPSSPTEVDTSGPGLSAAQKSMLNSSWTILGSLHLIFVGIMLLRNRSFPVLPGLKEFLQGDVAAFFAVLFGLPIFYLTLYVATEHCVIVRLPRPAHELSILRRIAHRLPVAFQSRIQGLGRFEKSYQAFFLAIFVIIPMILQAYLYVRLMEADVWRQREKELFSSSFQESLTKYVSPKEAFLNDNFRIGSIDDRPGVEKTINNITYFPFWQAWGFLLAELVALAWTLRLLWKLGVTSEPEQRSVVED